MLWLLFSTFVWNAFSAVETRIGVNVLDTPRTIMNSDFKGSDVNFDVEVLIPFEEVLVGVVFENHALKGKTETAQISLDYRKTAGLLGYRFSQGQYGPLDVTSDIVASYGIVHGTAYQEQSAGQVKNFTSDTLPSTSVYYSATYGYKSVIGGLKVGYQWTNLQNLTNQSGEKRPTISLSSPFIGAHLGFFY